MTDFQEESAPLTHLDKAAIRSYMLTLIAIPGSIVTVLAFFLGFLIQDVAMLKAENQVQRFKEKIEEQNTRVENVSKEISSLETSAKEMKQSLKDLNTFQNSNQFVVDVTNLLKNDEGFMKSIMPPSKITVREGAVSKYSEYGERQEFICPPDQVLIGIKSRYRDKYGDREFKFTCGILNIN